MENYARYQQPRRFVNRHRRKTLVTGAAFLAANFIASPGFACGGGPDPDSTSGHQSSTTNKKPKAKKEKGSVVTMSQSKFLRLSPAEIRKEYENGSGKKVEGFSYAGSDDLIDMAFYERKSTHRLVKDMAKLKTKEARKKTFG